MSVPMAPSLRKARELHHVSLCGSHVCVNVPACARKLVCVCMQVCACRWACVLGEGHCPFLQQGNSNAPQASLGHLPLSPPCRPPSRITSRVGRIGKARRLPSASASALAFQGRVDGGRQLGTRYPFSDLNSPQPWRTQFLGLSSKPESRGALPSPLAEPSYTCPSAPCSVNTMVELLLLQKEG